MSRRAVKALAEHLGNLVAHTLAHPHGGKCYYCETVGKGIEEACKGLTADERVRIMQVIDLEAI